VHGGGEREVLGLPGATRTDQETHRLQFQWWFGCGAEAIVARYRPMREAACRGELD
jgi:hypothetical protein